MCMARCTELEGRTADGVIKPLRSDRDASRDRIIGCECTGLQQIEHGIADQPTVNMQISVICQAAQHGTGYLAQPGLEGRAVTHPGSNMARDGMATGSASSSASGPARGSRPRQG